MCFRFKKIGVKEIYIKYEIKSTKNFILFCWYSISKNLKTSTKQEIKYDVMIFVMTMLSDFSRESHYVSSLVKVSNYCYFRFWSYKKFCLYEVYVAWKMTVSGVILVRIFPHSGWVRRQYLSVFSPNAGKCRPELLRIRTHFTQR